jgi:hypothetical protein
MLEEGTYFGESRIITVMMEDDELVLHSARCDDAING